MADVEVSDPERIFTVLEAHDVDYVVVGGLAVQVHGHVRTTNDLDLIPSPTRQNLARLADALGELDARVLNPGSEGIAIDAKMRPRATMWQFETSAGDIDVLRDAPGAASFADLRALAPGVGSRDDWRRRPMRRGGEQAGRGPASVLSASSSRQGASRGRACGPCLLSAGPGGRGTGSSA